eukprot:ANDGO_02473.mRNA.1 GTP-binding protein gtr2
MSLNADTDIVEVSKNSGSTANKSIGSSKPRILLMGLRRSGKSSIVRVVFQKMSPHETLFLESTSRIVRSDIANNSFVQFQVWDFPGQIDFFDASFDADAIFGGCGALVFVIDAQDQIGDARAKLITTIQKAHAVNPSIVFEVFIHKVDGLSDDHRIDIQRDIQQDVSSELADLGLQNVSTNFHLTSIYDHSIFEAFSKVSQKLIPQLPTLENLMDMFVQNSRIEKAFLFDVVSKIYIATDSAPVETLRFELCSDMIDVVIDISCIYSHVSAIMAGSDAAATDASAALYDEGSASIIRLNNKLVLYLREVNRYLALVCIVNEEHFEKQGLIDYNFGCFREAIAEIFDEPASKKKAKQ